MPHTVDEEGRCAIYAAAYAAHKVAVYVISVLARLKGTPQRCFGKPQLFANQEDRRNAQSALVLKERIVHIPEQACQRAMRAFIVAVFN